MKADNEEHEFRAKHHYNISRLRVHGRPPWDKLDPNCAYDMGMKNHAYEVTKEK